MLTKAKLIVNGETFDFYVEQIEIIRPDTLSCYHGVIPRLYAPGPNTIRFMGHLIPPDRIELPRTRQDRFTLASLVRHEADCGCTKCVANIWEPEDA